MMGYDGDAVRQNLLVQGILPVIPPRSNRSEPIPCDFRRYKDRNRIERMFNRLKLTCSHKTRQEQVSQTFCGFSDRAHRQGVIFEATPSARSEEKSIFRHKGILEVIKKCHGAVLT
jgi:transposase